jgi:hypothetical protein
MAAVDVHANYQLLCQALQPVSRSNTCFGFARHNSSSDVAFTLYLR